MGKKNLFPTVLKCETCDLTTKNHYIMKRHRLRCRQRAMGSGVDNGNKMDESLEPASSNTSGFETMPVLTMETGGEEAGKNDSATASVPAVDPPDAANIENKGKTQVKKIRGNPTAKKNCNYTCDKCSFVTRKSRSFLYHMVEEHKSKIDIFSCSYCDYCSQHKIKIQRHTKMNHKIVIDVDELKPEHAFARSKGHRPSPVKPVKRVRSTFITKNVPGKKLTVKFMKPGNSATTSHAPKPGAKASPSKSSQSMEHLSKVVEEIASEDGSFIFKCKECQFTNEDKQKVAKHAVSWHVDTKSFSCTYCDYITFDRNDFMAHRQVHRNEHQFRCEECTYSTDFRPNMDRHIMNHKNSFPHTCSFCTYGCGSEAAIRRHMLMNHDPVQNADTAEKKTKLPVPKLVETMQKTLKNVSEQKQKVANGKEETAITERDESMEADTVDGNIDADTANDSISRDRTDIQSAAPKLKGTVTQYVEKDNGKLLCPVCKLKYKRSSDLNRHMKRKHGCRLREYVEKHFNVSFPPLESARPPRTTQHVHVPLSMVNSRGEVGFNTEYLDYGNDDFMDIDDTYDSFDSYNRSQDSSLTEVSQGTSESLGGFSALDLSVRSGNDEKEVPPEKLKCPHCMYQAKWPSDYRRHIAVHSLERKYKCAYCPKKYKYIGDMNVHIRKDHNKEPGTVKVVKVPTLQKKKMSPALFKCPCCSYTSCYKSEVDRHTKLHGDEKSFQCKNCDYQSYWRGDMRRHMYKYHPELIKEGTAINDLIIIRKDKMKPVPDQSKEPEMTDIVTTLPAIDVRPSVGPFVSPGPLPTIETLTHTDPLASTVEPIIDEQSSLSKLSVFVDPEAVPSTVTPESMVSPQITATYPALSPSKQVTQPARSLASADQEHPPGSKSPTPSPIKDLGGGMYECNYCGFTANAPSKMNMHIATHTNLKQYKCPICGRRANWKWDISKHIKRDHNDFETQVVKLSKKEAEETIQEYMEGYPTVRRDHHLNVTPDRQIPHLEGVKFYKCSVCDFSAEKKLSVSRHISYMHSAVTARIVVIKKMPQDTSPQDTPSKASPQVTPSKESLQIIPSPQFTPNKTTASPQVIHSYASPQMTPIKTSPQVLPSAASTLMTSSKTRPRTPEKTSPQVTPSKTSPQIMHITPQITQSTPLSAADQDFIASPMVTPVYEPLQTSGSQPQTAEEIETDKPFMCSDCGKRGVTKGDVKKHYHYVHPNQEIRIVYLGDGSQSVYAAKSEIGQNTPEKNTVPTSSNATALGTGATSGGMGSSSPTNSSLDSSANISTGSSTSRSGSLPHPKVLGYIRPYKCSLCGRRSNWKWDLNNHIRDKHRNENAKVIILGETEAKATLDHYMKFELPVLLGTTVKADKETVEVPPPSKGTFRQLKCSGCAYRSDSKADVMRHIVRKHGGTRAKVNVLDKETARRTLPSYTYRGFSVKGGKDKGSSVTVNDPDLAMQVKSGVPKAQSEGGAQVILLQSGAQLPQDLTQQPVLSQQQLDISGQIVQVGVQVAQSNEQPLQVSGQLPQTAWNGLEKKYWKCSVCPYSNEDKVDVLKHMGKHNMKAYKCSGCDYNSNFRSGVYRHIRFKHGGDKTVVCKLTIKLIKEGPGLDSSGNQIMPEGVQIVGVQDSPKQHSKPQQSASPSPQKEVSVDSSLTVEKFYCKKCFFQSSWRSCVCRHLRDKHKIHDYSNYIMKRFIDVSGHKPSSQKTSTQAMMSPPTMMPPAVSEAKQASGDSKTNLNTKPKNFHCTLCPYKTYKSKMLKFHNSCHKPQPGVRQVKCKYCPYYVSGSRLLTQHMQLHLRHPDFVQSGTPPKGSPKKVPKSPDIPKRHSCERCPYTTNSKNDFLYHKQFHRPKPTADFKCEHCEYWVTHKRLLKQHMKVHNGSEVNSSNVSTVSTPTKSDYSENALIYDTVEIAAIKQRLIASKITPSISVSPVVSPMKLASNCTMGNKRGFLKKDGSYRKVHKCRFCPYMNIRLRNLRLHELMHGKRSSTHPLMKCPHCNYYVGSKGLLAHHLKVHQPDYGMEFLPNTDDANSDKPSEASEDSEMELPISIENKVDTLYEIARFKKFGCEKCPYASAKRSHFQRHVELHGSKQKCKCDFCDYSVPSMNLLAQHTKLHFEPNQNLLAAQSILNLQHLPEMPADVALASMMTNADSKHPVSVTHDHLELYENAPEDSEPKKLYRCDRCPYANVRRDHLLAHLRCHMVKNEFVCPFCDYSVGKTHILLQHVKVHFSPLPELSDWLVQSGDVERIKLHKEKDLKEAIELATLFQTERRAEKKKKEENVMEKTKKPAESTSKESDNVDKTGDAIKTQVKTDKAEVEKLDVEQEENFSTFKVDAEISFKVGEKKEVMEIIEKDGKKVTESASGEISDQKELNRNEEEEDKKREDRVRQEEEKMDTTDSAAVEKDKSTAVNKEEMKPAESYICQYCDREFKQSDYLVRHEMQHLIGNSYEELMEQVKASPHLSMVDQSPKVKGTADQSKMETEPNKDEEDDGDVVMSVPTFGEENKKTN